MKKRYIVLICLVFLFIPTYIAISYVITGSQAPTELQNIQSITVKTPDGEEFFLEYSKDNADAELFYSLLTNKKGVRSMSSKIDTKSYYEISYSSEDKGITYFKGYFTSSPYYCYLEYRNGLRVTYYQIEKEAAIKFLDSDYGERVHKSATIPALTVGGVKLNAVQADWNYRTFSSLERKAQKYTLDTGEVPNLGVVGKEFSCRFENVPDSIEIIISNSSNGAVIYRGNGEDVADITVDDNYDVSITVAATWNKKKENDFFGTVTYTALGRVLQPPFFFLSEQQINIGEFVVLSCKNVTDPQSIKFKAVPDIGFTPKFYKDGDYYRALIPISMALDSERNQYRFIVSAGGVEEILELLVIERSDESRTLYNISKETLESVKVTDNPYNDLYSRIKYTISTNTDFSIPYFSERFSYGYADGKLRAAFGDNIFYSELQNEVPYRNYDYFYAGVSNYMPVTAISDGKIVYVGNQNYTGQLVVVDHGYGLLSWYWNLGSLADGIQSGQMIEKGDVIGYNGGGGLTEIINGTSLSIHIAVTVFEVPVDMKCLTVKGVVVTEK